MLTDLSLVCSFAELGGRAVAGVGCCSEESEAEEAGGDHCFCDGRVDEGTVRKMPSTTNLYLPFCRNPLISRCHARACRNPRLGEVVWSFRYTPPQGQEKLIDEVVLRHMCFGSPTLGQARHPESGKLSWLAVNLIMSIDEL